MADPRYTKLKAEELLPAYSGMADAQKVAAINLARTAYNDVAWSAIRDVMMSNGDWGNLFDTAEVLSGQTYIGGGNYNRATRGYAVELRECCLYGNMARTSDDTIRTRIATRITALKAPTVGAVSQVSYDQFVALAQVVRSRAVEIDWPNGITVSDLVTARAVG